MSGKMTELETKFTKMTDTMQEKVDSIEPKLDVYLGLVLEYIKDLKAISDNEHDQ